jgi:LDH2 family malate/lactate/ureidoglycolate dehydrogenase
VNGIGRSTCTVDAEALVSLCRRCFLGLGLPSDDAEAVADVLVDANLRGTPSHGFQRLPAYMRRVRAGLAGGTDLLTIVRQDGGLCRIDAGHALGPAAAVKALRHAIALARESGVSLVAVGGSSHFGSAGYYARKAAEAGMAAMVMTNSVKRIAPYGAMSPFLGTNPLAIGIPLGRHDPFVLDMATSIEAGGKVMRAKEAGEAIPPGVALDAEGRATTDPARALAGSFLPIAGPKGSGLAMAISLLAVLLAGADCDDVMASLHHDMDRQQNVGHLFIVIDLAGIVPATGWDRAVEMIDRLQVLTPANGSPGVRYPGASREALASRCRSEGVALDVGEILLAAETCRECGLAEIAQDLLHLLPTSHPLPSGREAG